MSKSVVQSLDALLGVFFDSSSVDLVAQRLVHETDLIPGAPSGALVFRVTSKSELRFQGGFGSSELAGYENLSIWDDHPLAKACQGRVPVLGMNTGSDKAGVQDSLLFVPLKRGTLPSGVIVFQYREPPELNLADEVWALLGSVGGYYLSLQGQGLIRHSSSAELTPKELSQRQLDILGLVGQGLKNGQIAQRVLVSESTVRQETIKIYRILQVGNRQEAALKGKSLGLIS
jgi:DNA-binding CsgD family transcriptional regulator